MHLKDVTLIAVDCVHPQLAADALKESHKVLSFGEVVLVTSREALQTTKVTTSPETQIIVCTHLDSGEKVSEFMLGELHKYAKKNHLLNIQADGYVRNPYAWKSSYLDYDYIGAPWKLHPHHYWPPFPNVTEENRVGNGGFSLRS